MGKNYFCVEFGDGDKTVITRFTTREKREFYTCEIINGDTSINSQNSFNQYEHQELLDTSWVKFEGDPPIQWLEGYDLKITTHNIVYR